MNHAAVPVNAYMKSNFTALVVQRVGKVASEFTLAGVSPTTPSEPCLQFSPHTALQCYFPAFLSRAVNYENLFGCSHVAPFLHSQFRNTYPPRHVNGLPVLGLR